jgi:hypothetical protein
MRPLELTGLLGWAERVMSTLGEWGVGFLVLLETVFPPAAQRGGAAVGRLPDQSGPPQPAAPRSDKYGGRAPRGDHYALCAVLAGLLVWLIVRRVRRARERPGQD